MKRICVVALCGIVTACAESPSPHAVLFVDGDDVSFRGAITADGDGEWVSFDVWVPGNVVVFRTDATLEEGRSGEAGRAYRIREDLTLGQIGSVDLTKSDEELAAEFGVTEEATLELPQ